MPPKTAVPPPGAPEALDSPGLRGRAIEPLPLAFKLGLAERVRALVGVPSWARRALRLERDLEALEAALALAWRACAPAAWEAHAEAWDLGPINDAIDAYNALFPIERDLPMDPALRDFTEEGRRWRPRSRLDAAWILERFPVEGAGGSAAP